MSYGICRVSKVKSASGITGVQIHDRRERSHSNTNPDIDFSRCGENYAFCDVNMEKYDSYNDYINQQIKARYTGARSIRKDAVKMVEVIFTSDSAFFEGKSAAEQRSFFQSCLDFAKRHWGAENIISAIVHNDEKTPHLHLNFIPLTADGRLSAKDMLGGKKEMQQLQDDFYSEVAERYGLERGSRADLNNPDDIPRKHDSVADFKRKTKSKQLDAEIAEKTAILEKSAEKVSQIQSIDSIETKKSLFGGKVTMAQEDYDKVSDLAKKQVATESKESVLQTRVARLENENKSLTADKNDLAEQVAELKREKAAGNSFDLRIELAKARSERDNLQRKLDKVLEFIKGRGLWESLKAFFPAISTVVKGQKR